MKKVLICSVLFVLVIFIGFLFWLGLWVTSVDKHEFAFTFDRFNNGKIEVIDGGGWVVRNPFKYAVHVIDLRPYQITLSANKRVLNAKLVKFNPAGLNTFIEWHGRKAGDDIGRDSYINGNGNIVGSSGLIDILKVYAFDKAEGTDCPFLTVLQDIAPNQTGNK